MEALKQRSIIKGKKPTFTRQEYGRKKKIGDEWRRPRGMHSKMRLHFKGKKRSPEPGWGSPEAAKGLHPSGIKPILVSTIPQIDILKSGEGVVISSVVGNKKRTALIGHAKKKNIPILNIRNVDGFLKNIAEEMAQRKSKKKKQKITPKKDDAKVGMKEIKGGEESAQSAAKELESKETKDTPPEPNADDQKKKEKEEQDKLLTKRV